MGEREPWPRRRLARLGVDDHHVHRRMVDLHDVERAGGDEFARGGLQVRQRRDVVAFARSEPGVESADARVDGSPIRRPHARRVASLGDPLDQLGQLRPFWPEIEGLDLMRDERFAPSVERPRSSRTAEAAGQQRGGPADRPEARHHSVDARPADTEFSGGREDCGGPKSRLVDQDELANDRRPPVGDSPGFVIGVRMIVARQVHVAATLRVTASHVQRSG